MYKRQVYARPQLTLGYGAPFWQFSGFDGYLISTPGFAAAYAGWRASLPFLDVQFGRRWNYPFNRRYLPCLLYTSDAADERSSVDLGGRRIIKKQNKDNIYSRGTIQ